jgi:hypothetical protein
MSVTFADIRAMAAAAPQGDVLGLHNADKTIKSLEEAGFSFRPATRRAVTLLASSQRALWPQLAHPRVALYAAYDADEKMETDNALADLAAGAHAAVRLCAAIPADLRVYEMDMTPFSGNDAARETWAAHAISYGLMAVDEGVDILAVGSACAGHAAAVARYDAAMTRCNGDALAALLDPSVPQDMAGILGAALAARMACIPLLCGTRLYPVLVRALDNILGAGGAWFVCALADDETATWPDAVQIGAALGKIKTILALATAPQKTVAISNSSSASQAA